MIVIFFQRIEVKDWTKTTLLEDFLKRITVVMREK
jgi:hypothetical protein